MNDNILIPIRSGRLKVDVAGPGAFYKGPRFDWTGHVKQVTLDDRHTFCAVESPIHGKGTGGLGLCNEFGITKPVKPDPALKDGRYPKWGIGLLTPPEKVTKPPTSPAIAALFPMRFEATENYVEFTVDPVECAGYAARLVKRLTVENNTLTMNYSLQNTGKQTIVTDEYNHNFIQINDYTIGPDYRLTFPYSLTMDPSIEEVGDIFSFAPNQLSFRHTAEKVYYGIFNGFNKSTTNFWEMLHAPSGIGVKETVDFQVTRIAIWGEPHVLSPEFFITFTIHPGETAKWSRQYTFFC